MLICGIPYWRVLISMVPIYRELAGDGEASSSSFLLL
jgi:hypothetical protein